MDFKCVFCQITDEKHNLIDLNHNAVEFDNVIVEFNDIIEELFTKKVRNLESAVICETCKDLLVQFYIFNENVKNNNDFFQENPVLARCKDYLNECEDVQCIRKNEYLMLIPKNKIKPSWKKIESSNMDNLEQLSETEFEYQVEVEDTHDNIKYTEIEQIEILDNLDNPNTNFSQEEQQNEVIINEIESPKYYSCDKCEFVSEIKEEFNHHMLNHKGSTKRCCNQCSYYFVNHAHFTAHNNGHKLFDALAKYMNYPKCQSCNVMFVDDDSYEIHHQDHNLVPIESSGFFLKFGIKLEKQNNEKEDDSSLLDESSPKCGHCLKPIISDQELIKHLLIFHAKILTCPVDFRNFNNNQAFTIHMRNNHAELFPNSSFSCSVCKTEFETLYEKLAHMKNCKEKSFNCLHCHKTFSKKCHLVKHLKLVSGELNITCEICNKVCRDKHDYKIHSRSHSNEKLFKCSLCSRSYKTSSARAAHLQTHLETFICSHCNLQFKSRRTLQKHIKNKHDKNITFNSLHEIQIY